MGVKIPYRCVSSSTILIFGLLFQCSDKLGLSLELGSFAAGVMISTTDLARHTLEQVRLFFPSQLLPFFFPPDFVARLSTLSDCLYLNFSVIDYTFWLEMSH